MIKRVFNPSRRISRIPIFKSQWDRLVLRRRVLKGSEKSPHQVDPLSEIFHPRETLEKMFLEGIDKKGGIVLFSATIPTKAGLVSGDPYDPELEGPLLRRSIRHERKVKILPQYL